MLRHLYNILLLGVLGYGGTALANRPDLTVDAVALREISADETADALEFTIETTFRNRGEAAAANGFTWRAWLSTDKALQSADQLIFSSTTPLDLGAGATVTDRGRVRIAPAPTGNAYYVLVEVDPTFESGCTSNCIGSTVTPFVKGVELVAASISGAQTTVTPGQPVVLNVRFFNQGVGAPLKPVEFRILASRDALPDSSDRVVHEGSVTMQGGTEFNSPVTLNRMPANGLAGGDYRWILQVDPSNQVTEPSETNNAVVSAMPGTHAKQADLQADSVDLVDVNTGVSKRVADIGEPVRFDVKVSNVGDFAAGNYKVEFVLSKDNNLSLVPGADFLFGETEVTGVQPGPGNQKTEQITVRVPTTVHGQPLPPGNYYFFVFLDSWNTIHELNDVNNTAMVAGQVQLRLPSSDYKAMSVRAPAAAAAGEAIELTRTFANIGTEAGAEVDYGCFASKNQIIASGDFPLAFVNADGSTSLTRKLQLARGEVNSATEQVRLPYTLPAGGYYIGCLVDPTNAVAELDELNNAAMTNDPVSVTAQAFQVVTQQLPDGLIGVPYRVKLSTSGATEAPTFTTPDTHKLPAGLSFSADGTVSGTPTELGVTSFRVIATSGAVTHESVVAVRVLPTTAQVSITTDRLPPALNSATTLYEAALSAAGGAGPYTWSITGMLPNGIFLDPNTGHLRGEPRPGTPSRAYSFTASVRDQLGGTASKAFEIRLMPAGALAITTLALQDAVVGQHYFTDLSASVMGGAGMLAKPLTWSLVSGPLPPGMRLTTHTDGASGIIDGTPLVAGTYPVTIQVVDKEGRFDAVDMLLTVHTPHLRVFTESLPRALHPGDPVDSSVLSSSDAPVRFRLYSGALPEGVSLDASGKISGTIANTATAHGAWNFVVEAVDERGATGLGVFMLEVVPATQAQGCGCSTGSAGATGAVFALLAMARTLGRRRRNAQ